ncbi:hypothetical protein [Lentzea flava]|uniref:Uncharacterized protein n=1 Tax=Lentzea flava TaxID=103732 RepID=A0ABQ2VL84_9PSEU|nr:hypothetical protein [Lentzea flava]MCP2205463.1 hypothetical protein [Lentzea flava]GGU87442.1 hypothetical protein GCM10010178_91550 [Lentzea flava]
MTVPRRIERISIAAAMLAQSLPAQPGRTDDMIHKAAATLVDALHEGHPPQRRLTAAANAIHDWWPRTDFALHWRTYQDAARAIVTALDHADQDTAPDQPNGGIDRPGAAHSP